MSALIPQPWLALHERSSLFPIAPELPGAAAQPVVSEVQAVASDVASDLIAALKEIAYEPGCGCMPCMGQCRSKELLEDELANIRDFAREAISKATRSAS